ncbi:MAG: septum site-determining protein MinC [Anaerolineales bacterium]
MSEPNTPFQIKGLRDGLLITFPDSDWEDLQHALVRQVQERKAFFQGARLALDVGAHILHVNELSALRDRLSESGVSLWAVISESPTTEKTAQLLGLATRISKPRPQEVQTYDAVAVDDETALFVNKTLRSGMRIEFPGHVVVLGDVNPGAEVVAEGNVIVWGRVRGMLHAGAGGDKDAVICALELMSPQLRIADQVSGAAHAQANHLPEVVSLSKDGRLQRAVWNPK